ncbi:MAG: PTS ascorbate transporter subunit IIC, partial [Selenomonas sp.]|nr:PTS ascorbate transporter subunit IIC [Selenomonas sp.]
VLIGFLSSFVGGVIGMGVLLAMDSPVNPLPIILPSVVPHFFCGATAGVFGNATGGLRGAVLGAMAHGILITFLPVFLMPVLGNLGFANTTFSDADFCVVGTILGNVINFLK